MEEWNNGNDFFHGATLLATNAHRPILLRTQITTAYSNQISVPADECGHLIVLPLSQRLLHSPLAMTAWLANLSCRSTKHASHPKYDKTNAARAQSENYLSVAQPLVFHLHPSKQSI